ncbi:hypothetical protein ACFLYU_00280 [Candidatus Dependentiae bacterium]
MKIVKCYLFFHFCIFISTNMFSENHDRFESKVIDIVIEKDKNNMLYGGVYDVIKKFLDKYKRPFTMIDVGAGINKGFYSFMVAHQYDSVCVMLEGEGLVKKLLEKCLLNFELNNIILLHNKITPNSIRIIKECEHFDVVLLSNIKFFLNSNWKKTLTQIFNLGDHVITIVPDRYEGSVKNNYSKLISDIKKFLCGKKSKIIGKVENSLTGNAYTIYLSDIYKRTIETSSLIWGKLRNISYSINSTFSEKFLTKSRKGEVKVTKWIPGINFITFKAFRGIYPDKEALKEAIDRIKDPIHTDWSPANMIIQGKNIELIDFDDERPAHLSYSERLKKTLFEFIDIDHYDYDRRLRLIMGIIAKICVKE